MLKRNSKALAIVMAFVFCLSFLAPAFVAPDAAQAAVTYSALSIPAVSDNTPVTVGAAGAQSLGIIQIDIDNCAAIKAGDVLTVSFGSEINLNNAAPGAAVPIATLAGTALTSVAGTEKIDFPATIGTVANALGAADVTAAITSTKTTLDITFAGTFAGTSTDPGRILIYFNAVRIGSIDGDVVATILGPANGAFPTQNLTVAKVNTSGDVISTVKSVKTFGTGGGLTDSIIISETIPGSLTAGNVLELKLPTGFSWNNGVALAPTAGTFNWGFATTARAGAALAPNSLGIANPLAPVANSGDYMWAGLFGGTQLRPDPTDDRVLLITIPAATTSATGSGQIRFAGSIAIDEDVAKEGEVVAVLSDALGDINDKELTLINYASYGAKVVEGTTKEIIAGKHDQKIGSFFIEESVGGSLLNNRNVKIILPKGVKWSGAYEGGAAGLPPAPTREKGDAALAVSGCASPYDTLKLGITGGTTKSKWEFKDYRVDIAPDFSGDLKITVAGDGGVTGEVVVATVKPAVDLSAEEIKNVRIGEQNQVLGTMIIKESKKENVALNSANIDTWTGAAAVDVATLAGELAITLPGGAEWSAGYPTVEVTEGDLELKVKDMSKSADNRTIFIPVKSESTKVSTIRISDMKATLYRTVPEGEFKIAVSGNAINETGGQLAFVNLAFPQYEDVKVAVANCVTPAPGEGTDGAATGQFKITSNIYYVNGVAKVMDVAPYIKASRTYVPMRYVGEIIGAEVLWDDAARTVTLTKGDDKVVFTIGSTTYTVNGEAKVADVAPEITNDRTMLPARFVAEGFGYVVGWDPGTQTVLVSK